jgi:pyruvoyl-dependent arginine decarboxylase (PvlArgDC)
MAKLKFYISISRSPEANGLWYESSVDKFDMIVESTNASIAENMLRSQYGHNGRTIKVNATYQGTV